MDKDIPKNLDEAIERLECNISPKEQSKIAAGELDVILGHHTVGRWIRNSWGLWAGSELRDWFFDRGIHHADDMSGIILESFQRHLRGKKIDLEGQIEHYQNYWKDKGISTSKEIEKIKNNNTMNEGDITRDTYADKVDYEAELVVEALNKLDRLNELLRPYSDNRDPVNKKEDASERTPEVNEMEESLDNLNRKINDLLSELERIIDNFRG